jgi:protein RecA
VSVERVRLKAAKGKKRPNKGSDYFPEEEVQLVSTGCTLLDCVLGGGWALGRIANIVGDKSVGKTLLAIEAAANFDKKYPKGMIWYREAEAAFDLSYAKQLGLPVKRVDFGPQGTATLWATIEDIYEDLTKKIDYCRKHDVPGLYIVDSLDALSSRATLARAIDDGSYNLDKQKMLSDLFSRLSGDINAAKICVLIVSQVRDNIGVRFGAKHRRSGGKSLDFYASHIIWLRWVKNLTRTVNGVKRVTAIRIKARCTKNKIAMAFRECEFTLRFGYGVDDFDASMEWLVEVKRLDALGLPTAAAAGAWMEETEALPDRDYAARMKLVRNAVCDVWDQIEDGFRPSRRKYG